MSTLRQSQLRADRAAEKLAMLERFIEGARKDALKASAEQADLNAAQPFQDFVWSVADEARLLTSDCALHARVALDYIVFALARRDTRIEQEGTQFPINECVEDFARNRTGCLEHLTTEHITMIEDFQPYKGFRLRPLIMLHKLSNETNIGNSHASVSLGGSNKTLYCRQAPLLSASPRWR